MYGRTNVTQKQNSWPHKTLCKTSAQICTQHQRMIAKGLYCQEIQHHKCWLSTFLQLPAKFRTFQTYLWHTVTQCDTPRSDIIGYDLTGSHNCPKLSYQRRLRKLSKGWSRTEQDGDVTLWQDDINLISIVWAPNVTKNNGPGKVGCHSFVQQHPLHPGAFKGYIYRGQHGPAVV